MRNLIRQQLHLDWIRGSSLYQQTILELYMFEQCQTFVDINCDGQFSIIQTLYDPIDLKKSYSYESSPPRSSDLINSFTFNVDKEELLIIIFQNELELLDSYRIILRKLNSYDELEIQQSNMKTYYQLLNVGRYELFMIGQLIYSIYFQNQLISEHFIFSKFETMDYQNIAFIVRIGLVFETYLILQQGECEIISTHDHGQQIIQLQQGIYIFRIINLEIRIISQPLVIAIISIHDTILFYPTNLYIVNHISHTLVQIWSRYNIRINPLDEQIQVVESRYRDVKYQILNLNNPLIYEFRIELEQIHLNGIDAFQLRIHYNTSIICNLNIEEYSLRKIVGKFEYQYSNQRLQISTSTFTNIIFTKRSINIIDFMLNKVYKIQSSVKFRVNILKDIYLKIYTFPDIDIRAYYDYQQQHKRELINGRIKFEYDKHYYSYIIATSDEPFYIIIMDFLDNYIQYPKVILRLSELAFMNDKQSNVQAITPSKSLNIQETNNGNFTSFRFNQESSLVCLIQYSNQKFIQLQVNELQTIDQGQFYVIYLQQDTLLIILESQLNSIELQFEIMNTDINQLPRIYNDSLNSTQNYQYQDNNFIIRVISHTFLDLEFFECQKLDCILKIQNNNQSSQMQFLTCVKAELGLVQIFKHIFTCQSLLNKDILRISGLIEVDRTANYIHCKSENCLVWIIDANMTAPEIPQLDIFIQLNQVYRNLSRNEFIFYNNQSQIIRIDSDDQWQLYNIDEIQIDVKLKLRVGYCYLTFSQVPLYIVIFTYPRILYQDLTYSFTRQEEFVLLNLDKTYFILQFYNSSGIEICIDNHRKPIIGQQLQSILPINKTITLIGDASFMIWYVEQICYLLAEPKILVSYNKTITIKIELNNDCIYEFVEVQLNNQSFRSIITKNSKVQIDASQNGLYQNQQPTNHLQYQVLIKTYEYTYSLYYEAEVKQPHVSAHYNIIQFAFLLLLIVILRHIIKLHHQDGINEPEMINQYKQ